MTDPADPEYHLRDLMLDRDLVLRLMEWHGGMGTQVYSLGSTALHNLVSPSMIDAAVEELERDRAANARRPPDRQWSEAELAELEGLISELDAIARFPDEYRWPDNNQGYATWLMEEEEEPQQNPPRRNNPPPPVAAVPGQEIWGVYDVQDREIFLQYDSALEVAANASRERGGAPIRLRKYTGLDTGAWAWGPMVELRMRNLRD